jgi:hydrogenase nickel incorporation protein HypA/HybF
MHEYSLAENLIESILPRLAAEGLTAPGRVREVALRIGALEIHSEESFAQAFAMRTAGTPLEGAALRLDIIPGRIHCDRCDRDEVVGPDDADPHSHAPVMPCPDCGTPCRVEGGRGIEPIDLVIDE